MPESPRLGEARVRAMPTKRRPTRSKTFQKSSAIRYRQVRRLAVATVVELYQAGGWWQESPAWRRQIPAMIKGSLLFVIAQDADHRVIGMGRAISDGVSDAYIQDVVVRREFRGRGVGAGIIRTLTELLKAREIGWIGLVAEPGTTAFYERLGYKPLANYQPMLCQR